tara:strand:+ start:529 stop:678 length:150 start_codon:yes stop_codon:yes gene_type:complete
MFNINSVVEEVKSEGGVIGQQGDDSEKQIWKCEFCNYVNDVCIDEEEKP